MAANQPTPQKQFFSFSEAVLLPVYDSKVTLNRLWEAYLTWWDTDGDLAFGGVPLDRNDFQMFLARQYGKPDININGNPGYSSLYIKHG